ncbi:pyridoxamine 5'-phosphate oxidase family protein [Actinopolymorpha sp. B17G11]|uniref:pyridoxamine 5'-phosphate oxidase family protein n=1 Tax=unclassified Actinopolymorpha TaxID=2627063 RepID=UPI0032D928F0
MFESAGLEVLEPSESLRLLGDVPIGRIVFTDQAMPAVQPVNFIIDGDAVLIRTAPGSKLDAAARNAIVAFEVDDIDQDNERGWSVTVIGHAEMVTDEAELARVSGLPLRSWSPDERNHLIRIRMEIIQGRRIVTMPARLVR